MIVHHILIIQTTAMLTGLVSAPASALLTDPTPMLDLLLSKLAFDDTVSEFRLEEE